MLTDYNWQTPSLKTFFVSNQGPQLASHAFWPAGMYPAFIFCLPHLLPPPFMPSLLVLPGSDCPCHTSEKSRPAPVPQKGGALKVVLAPGEKKYLCMCGQSKNFPYCDGSHKAYNAANNTSFKSLVVEADEEKTLWLCTCSHSKNRPYCDGSHSSVHKVGEKMPE